MMKRAREKVIEMEERQRRLHKHITGVPGEEKQNSEIELIFKIIIQETLETKEEKNESVLNFCLLKLSWND